MVLGQNISDMHSRTRHGQQHIAPMHIAAFAFLSLLAMAALSEAPCCRSLNACCRRFSSLLTTRPSAGMKSAGSDCLAGNIGVDSCCSIACIDAVIMRALVRIRAFNFMRSFGFELIKPV